MLKIIHKFRELPIKDMLWIYAEGIQENGKVQYKALSENEQILSAEQDMYDFLRMFMREESNFYALWGSAGRYVSALRMEPYQDGYLLEALETAPDVRGRGYAKALVQETLGYLKSVDNLPVYSHINKNNLQSLAVHCACGFERILEHAVYIDGSIMHNCCTMCFKG